MQQCQPTCECFRTPCRARGVALIAVLSVLTVLAVLAASFAVLIQLDTANANAQAELQRLNLLLASGVNHAIVVLQQAQAAGETITAAPRGSVRAAFGSSAAGANARGTYAPHMVAGGRWIPVVNSRGIVEGRYRVTLEDEAAKVNLTTSFLLHPSRGSGWLPGELALARATGLPTQAIQRILHFRYGPDNLPGAYGDDDRNNVLLMSDGIDNNANGVIDEDDEGVDDPGEYSPYYPMGDDRRITSMSEALQVVLGGPLALPLDARRLIQRELPRRATLYSVDLPGSASLPDTEPADINVVNARQARRLIGRANMLTPFAGVQRDLDHLAANLTDYRDQNHVLSTVGASYGVEAVCFNELLANDGTAGRFTSSGMFGNYGNGYFTQPDQAEYSITTSDLMWEFSGILPDQLVPWSSVDFNYGGTWNYKNEGGWDVEISSGNKQRVTLLGPAKRVDPQTGAVSEGWHEISSVGSILRQRYDRYLKYVEMRRDIGEYGPVQVRGNPGFTGKGPQTYWNFKWPVDFFKNCRISLGYTGQDYGHTGSRSRGSVVTQPGAVRIVGSSADGVLQLEHFNWVSDTGQPVAGPPSNGVSRCVIWGWMIGVQLTAYDPDMISRFTFQGLRPRTYYLPMANAWVSWSQRKPRLGFAPYPQVWDDDREYEGSTRKWTYGGEGNDAVPVRTSKGGRMDVYFKSGSTARFERPVDKHGNCVVGMTFLRPEVMELLNISPRAISLKNWTLTFNTGTMANDIGSIDTALGYGPPGGSSSTPVIEGNSYFYLVNNATLFNIEHGSGAPVPWGRGAGQQIPAWEIPTTAWGVQYRIKEALSTGDNSDQETVNKMRFTFENERFGRDHQFKGEVFEVLNLDRPEERRSRLHGSRYVVSASGRNWIEFRGDRIGWQRGSFRPPNLDTLMIIGMPAKGGLVSMTLKNEYKQIVARAIEYAYLDSEPLAWMGSSAEKIDPSHAIWVVRRTPTLGGTPAQARNDAMRSTGRAVAHVKNGPYVSVGEVHRVRSARAFENLGAGRRGGRQRDALATLASVFGASALRLEACDERVVHTGWQQALHTVSAYQLGSIRTQDAAWEIDQWRLHTVRFMTGALRGEMFPVAGNTRTTVQVSAPHDAMTVRSTPGRKPLQPSIGDVFTIGPGYASGLCYARQPEQHGEWTWRQRIGVPGNYHLYIFGLNDSISTTEFLEENANAALDVAVWNYAQAQYDTLARRQRYGKDDGIYAGRIAPAHISASGDFKLRLTAHGVGERGVAHDVVNGVTAQQRRQSGYAWFNYAMLTPVPVPGRVNANTANPRLLASLPGITPALAHDICHGIDSGGRAALKPYATLGDLLNVRGMTAEIFERSANMFCLDSSAYTIDVQAQTVKDINADGIFDEQHEPVQGERHKRLVVRTGMGTTAACAVDALEQYTP